MGLGSGMDSGMGDSTANAGSAIGDSTEAVVEADSHPKRVTEAIKRQERVMRVAPKPPQHHRWGHLGDRF